MFATFRVAALSIAAAVLLANSPMASADQTHGEPKVCIVRPDRGPRLVQHAADELARYVGQMTGGGVTIAKEAPKAAERPTTVILSVKPAADRLTSLSGADDRRRLRDGFWIHSSGNGQLEITATQPIGLLYGVYEYLETCCGVGFFWDGDHVPKRSALPIGDIDIAQAPRWPVRHFGLSSCWGLAKWHHQFRTMAHRKQMIEWMVKRRINRTHHFFGPTIAASGQPAVDVYGISDTEPDNFTFAGWPGCLGWPAKVRTQIIKDQLDYARQRGMTWIYYLAYGNLPHQFRQTHPQYKYVGQLGYSATVLYPDDPQAARWSKAFYQAIIETYGTDHIYQDCPFVESTGATDAEKSFQLKLTAAREMCKVFKALDDQAIWESDAWDFGALPHVWTAERIKRYFKGLPQEMMLIYDTAGLGNPFYKRTNYFEGTPWALGILHSFQGDDHLHGDLAHAIGAIQALSKDPKADKCVGIYHVPESTGHNVLFFDLTCHLAWRPDALTLADYLRDYVKRRFGEKDLPRMLPAVQALVGAVYSGGRGAGVMPIYQKLGCHYGPREWWPIVDDRKVKNDGYDNIAKVIPDLRRAIRLALACRDTQQDNPLYVNDMVDWTRTYLAHVFNWAVLDAYRALNQGKAKRVAASVAMARRCLKHIEAILSTRPDFSLQAQIERAMKVPGANPYLPWYMKQHCVNDLYSANEVYEQLHWYYGPRMAVYLGELEARAARGVKTITWKDVEARCGAIHTRWLEKDIAVPTEHRFKGTTMAAVTAAMTAIEGPPGKKRP